MASRLKILIDLLHAPGDIGLATLSAAVPGYPFATSVPFATDEHHRPLMLISRLAHGQVDGKWTAGTPRQCSFLRIDACPFRSCLEWTESPRPVHFLLAVGQWV